MPANQKNLLTGLGDLSEGNRKRPVAVMVNNVQDTLPQYGVNQADIIYGNSCGGDVTRLMAITGTIQPCRRFVRSESCRYYFPAFFSGI